MIDLHLLGTGGMMPLPGRWLSSLLARCEGELTLFDCGEGTQIPWRQSGWGFKRLSSICLSHTHADHIAGLPGVLFSVANAERTDPLTIFGPQGTLQTVHGLAVIVPGLPFDLFVRELGPEATVDLPGRLTLTAGEADHRGPCLYYRVDRDRDRRFEVERAIALGLPVRFWSALQRGESITWEGRDYFGEDFLGRARRGVSFGFVTDTRPVESMKRDLAGVDLLICEGTYGDDADLDKAILHKHMTFAEAAELARDCEAGELWLTHFSPAMTAPNDFEAKATQVFGATTIGYSGLHTTLAFPASSAEKPVQPAGAPSP